MFGVFPIARICVLQIAYTPLFIRVIGDFLFKECDTVFVYDKEISLSFRRKTTYNRPFSLFCIRKLR